jgi:hypothetical protein
MSDVVAMQGFEQVLHAEKTKPAEIKCFYSPRPTS